MAGLCSVVNLILLRRSRDVKDSRRRRFLDIVVRLAGPSLPAESHRRRRVVLQPDSHCQRTAAYICDLVLDSIGYYQSVLTIKLIQLFGP
jgi:hypothetical protein